MEPVVEGRVEHADLEEAVRLAVQLLGVAVRLAQVRDECRRHEDDVCHEDGDARKQDGSMALVEPALRVVGT